MGLFSNKISSIFIIVFCSSSIIEAQFDHIRPFYDKFEYRKKRHEVNIGFGASSCLTDLGGANTPAVEITETAMGKIFKSAYDVDIAKTKYVINLAHIYHLTGKLNFRTNISYASVTADDAQTKEFYRNNRNLNFTSTIIEGSGILEWVLSSPTTGTKYNLRDVSHHKLAKRSLGHLGFYLLGGVGFFHFNPTAYNNFTYNTSVYANSNFTPIEDNERINLRELHTEGQGMPGDPAGFDPGETYKPIALCIPLGFGITKAFNGNTGIKLEAGFRYTTTDYLDDVSTFYYNREALKAEYGAVTATMSGTNSGTPWEYIGYNQDPSLWPEGSVNHPDHGTNAYIIGRSYTEPGFQRGNPNNKDTYMFMTLSYYQKFNNKTKSYRTINTHQKRKIKASF